MPQPQQAAQTSTDIVRYNPLAARLAIESWHAAWGWHLEPADDAMTACTLAHEIARLARRLERLAPTITFIPAL